MMKRRLAGFTAGAVVGLGVIWLAFVLRLIAGVPTLPELLVDRIVLLTPGPVFGFLIDRLQLLGRPLLYAGALLGELVVFGALGWVVVVVVRHPDDVLGYVRQGDLRRRLMVLAVVLWIVLGVIILPLAGDGIFAARTQFPVMAVTLGFLVEAVVYVVGVGELLRWFWLREARRERQPAADTDPLRRQVASGVAVATIATLGGTVLWRYQAEQPGGANATKPVAGARLPGTTVTSSSETAEVSQTAAGVAARTVVIPRQTVIAVPSNVEALNVTPNASFYLVSKDLGTPHIATQGWQLTVDGLVRKPLHLTYEQLIQLPAVEEYVTLECISNTVGGPLISNARWKGVRLSTLLDQAGAEAGGFVLFRSVDGYTESLPMAEARQPMTLVAYQMNGAPLPAGHGFPARVVVPGHYGMKSPKWLATITVSHTDRPGFWEQQGWNEAAVVRTNTRIVLPLDQTHVRLGPVTIAGVAFAGTRGIRAVQVAIRPDVEWDEARLVPPSSPAAWTVWFYQWQATRTGGYRIQARAIDGTGAIQQDHGQSSFPRGAGGLPAITVRVVG
ncbi:MAG: molybdopterin-dependent oxidoreductase [Chloroflexi bacterium]|nr:molybdopterin-dependent oxidoreductase [Chloroflexota bacterium]